MDDEDPSTIIATRAPVRDAGDLRAIVPALTIVCDSIEAVRRRMIQVADLDVSTLLRGESGTGKELVAHAIARASGRGEPMVDVNITTIPSAMASAELFGHEKGAFTGATESRPGWSAQATSSSSAAPESRPSRRWRNCMTEPRSTGDMCGIAVLDQVVVGFDGYSSMAERAWR
jgi:hypothetical protein